jgi:uncharacterized protein
MNETYITTDTTITIAKTQQAFLTKVYSWMMSGLLITGATSYLVLNTESFGFLQNGGIFMILIVAEFALVIALSAAINKMSKAIAGLAFTTYSFLNGLTLSVILFRYTSDSITSVFLTSAAMFAAVSVYGLTTKKSLGSLGSFMFMGLIGIVFASILNFFFASTALGFAINVIGVFVFLGLAAYDNQKLKDMAIIQEQGDEIAAKGAILGALTLYLDFINLFLFLLRLLGNRK